MPRTKATETRNVLRVVNVLTELPRLWRDLDDEAIAESLASALVRILDADFVYIHLAGHPQIVDLACGPEGRVSAERIPAIRDLVPVTPNRARLRSARSGDLVRVVSTPLGSNAESRLVVGSGRSTFPTGIDRLILRIAANEATTAMERAECFAVSRHLTALVNLSSNFIGVAGLQGVPLFVNPAGLRLCGLASMQEALELHVVDFLEGLDRDRARYEVWPEVMSTGRWGGQLSFLNTKTGAATPLLVESLRIDAPTGEPLAVGTISVDIGKWNRAEYAADGPPDLITTRQLMIAVARVESLSAREHQILYGLVAGHSQKVTAHELGLSVRTVEAHRARMKRRLGVRTLAEAIKLALMSGTMK